MELEQIIKRLEWLDEERRKDKNMIAVLEERINQLESNSTKQLQTINDISSDLTRAIGLENNINELDTEIGKSRVEFGRALESVEKQRAERDREAERIRLMDVEQINKNEKEMHQLTDKIELHKKEIAASKEEDARLARLVEESRKSVEDNVRANEEYHRAFKLMEDNRRSDAKRLADLQGEVAALRKRSDEQRSKQDVQAETLRKIDLRTTEIQNLESDRRQAQLAFIDKQNSQNVEREHIWKDWQTRFNDIDKKSAELDAQIQTLDNTIRAVKRSQEALDEVTQRFERRINEITEMQRLSEDRFRNEWNGLKADDQKRWATFSLTHEEQQRETNRNLQKITERLVNLEDLTSDLQYQLQQTLDNNQKRMQTILTMLHQWSDSEES